MNEQVAAARAGARRSDEKVELSGARLQARRARRAAMRATSRFRPLPGLLVIGAPKCGTTSLFDYLVQHPDVQGSNRKELYFFDQYYTRGERWYRGQFPLRREGALAVEATPNYLSDPRVPARANEMVPDARLVVVLRDPVERLVSHWAHRHRTGREPRSLDELVAAQIGDPPDVAEQVDQTAASFLPFLRQHMFQQSYYAHHLRNWWHHFDRDRTLVLFSDDLFAHPAATTVQVQRFAGLERVSPADVDARNTRQRDADLDPALHRRLRDHFEPHDAELSELLDLPLPWRGQQT